MSTPLGAASSSTSSVSRSSFQVRGTIIRPMTSEAIGSAACQPVSRITTAETITATEPSASAATSRNAPRTFRLSFWPRISSASETRFADQADRAEHEGQPALGVRRRDEPLDRLVQRRSRRRRAAADSWPGRRGSRRGRSRRCARSLGGRFAKWMASSAMPRPSASVAMCAASAIRASESASGAADDLDDHDAERDRQRDPQPAAVRRGRRTAGRARRARARDRAQPPWKAASCVRQIVLGHRSQ